MNPGKIFLLVKKNIPELAILSISHSNQIKEKTNSNFNFHTSLWYLKRFYEGFKGLHKTFWGTTNKCEK